MTKTIYEIDEETAASESVAHLSELDIEGDLIHTLKESLTGSQTMCFVFNYKIADCTWFLVQFNILMQLNKNISINVSAHLKGI